MRKVTLIAFMVLAVASIADAQWWYWSDYIKKGTPQQIESIIIRDSMDASLANNLGETSLMIAAEYNKNPKVVGVLLTAGVDPNARSKTGMTALMYATLNPNEYMTEELLSLGADVSEKDNGGATALLYAITKSRNASIVRFLANAGADVNEAFGEDRQTVLDRAAYESKNPDVLSVLLMAGADVNARDGSGRTALVYAALNREADMVAPLLKAGANVNEHDNSGLTPLMTAANAQNLTEVRSLILSGADVNEQEPTGMTVLMAATVKSDLFSPDPQIIAELIKAGARIEAQDKSGRTALMTAIEQKNVDDVEALIKAGAKTSIAVRYGNGENTYTLTPLILAAGNDSDLASLLLKHGESPNQKNENGLTPLIAAASAQNSSAVDSLLQAGAQINAQTNKGNTALMVAVMKHDPGSSTEMNLDIVSKLISAGADVRLKNTEGKTAFDLAKDNDALKDSDVLKRLEEAMK